MCSRNSYVALGRSVGRSFGSVHVCEIMCVFVWTFIFRSIFCSDYLFFFTIIYLLFHSHLFHLPLLGDGVAVVFLSFHFMNRLAF